MSEQLNKLNLVKERKWERRDSLDNIGVSTYSLLKDAIKEGKFELAQDLTDYLYFWEIKFVRDANLDLVGGFPSFFMANYGEDKLYDVYKEMMTRGEGNATWPVPPVKKRDMTAYEWSMDYAARMVRPHRMGRNDGIGGFTFEEYEDRFEVPADHPVVQGRQNRICRAM